MRVEAKSKSMINNGNYLKCCIVVDIKSMKKNTWYCLSVILFNIVQFVFQSFPISNRAELSVRGAWKSGPRLSGLSQIWQGIIGNTGESSLVLFSGRLWCFLRPFCYQKGVSGVGEAGGKKKKRKK